MHQQEIQQIQFHFVSDCFVNSNNYNQTTIE